MPYQCLERSGHVLFAATGACLNTFDISTGSKISRWSYTSEGDLTTRATDLEAPNLLSQKSETSSIDIVLESEPPSKKRRLSGSENEDETTVKEKAPRRKQKRPTQKPSAANIVALTCTSDGQYVVIVTGEDKTVRVLGHDGHGVLKQLSTRAMPKRPCAIALTSDDKTIVCADKFGDVYAIPLIKESAPQPTTNIQPETAEVEPKAFVPSASTFTVHSKRNREALEQQQKQIARKSEKADRQDIKFEHKLLLGHVSMLTDVAVITRGSRSYIITADRDEHIRISRGIPQTHIIENFCLGHTEFVSRICLPSATPDLLISGGGEDDLYIWNWQSGTIVGKFNMRPLTGIDTETKTVVSGIHEIWSSSPDGKAVLAVTIEATALILILTVSTKGEVEHRQTLRMDGNVLDVATNSSSDQLLASLDLLHEIGSSTSIKPKVQDTTGSLVSLSLNVETYSFEKDDLKFQVGNEEAQDMASLSTLLYGLENLRKRGGENDEEI